MITRHRNQKSLFLFTVSILVVTSMVLSLLLVSCGSSVTEEEGALPEKEAAPPAVVDTGVILLEGNDLPKTQLQLKRSPDLEDNHIGVDLGTYYEYAWHDYSDPELVYSLGVKWIRIAFDDYYGDPLNWQNVEVEPGKYLIDPAVDEVISEYASNDITIVLNLGVGNEDNHPDVTRFRDNDTLERYCNYVRFMVNHFKDRIKYYEIWNEPEKVPEYYIYLVKHVIPVIRQENPEAKIVIGALCGEWITGYPGYDYERYSIDADYIKEFLGPDMAPIIDVISWHPFYCTMPHDLYYQNYPQMVEEIKEFAASNGFKGEYLAEEILWKRFREEGEPGGPVSERTAAKYYARSIIMHRGLDLIVSSNLWEMEPRIQPIYNIIQNMCTVMAGTEPIDLPIEIESEATNIRSYSFSLPNGDELLALWTDGVAVDNDPGIEATLTLPGFSAQKVTGIDVLNGFEQELVTSVKDGDLVIRDLLVKDYPIILRLTP